LKKENAAWLVSGFALGLLVGVGLVNAIQIGVERRPAPGPTSVSGAQPAGTADAQAALAAEVFDLAQRLEQAPDDLTTLVRLAHIHHDRGSWEAAAAYYERAVALVPDDADLLTDLGICYRRLGRFDEALNRFARAREADESHWQSLYNRAVVLAFDLGRHDEAVEVLRPLLATDSPPPQLAELLAGIEQARTGARGEP
jgi:tetratricopeptide (TPR) repeat protein